MTRDAPSNQNPAARVWSSFPVMARLVRATYDGRVLA
jgi:hypothetical protein